VGDARGYDRRAFPAVHTGSIACLFVVVAWRLVDDRVLGIAQGTGEPDNIPGSRSHNFRFHGVFYHDVALWLQPTSNRGELQSGFDRLCLEKKVVQRLIGIYPAGEVPCRRGPVPEPIYSLLL
jgi:hypothetical protein